MSLSPLPVRSPGMPIHTLGSRSAFSEAGRRLVRLVPTSPVVLPSFPGLAMCFARMPGARLQGCVFVPKPPIPVRRSMDTTEKKMFHGSVSRLCSGERRNPHMGNVRLRTWMGYALRTLFPRLHCHSRHLDMSSHRPPISGLPI
jgi:hypothetical protein